VKTGVKIIASFYGIVGTVLSILWVLMAVGVFLLGSILEQISITDVNTFIDLIQQYTPIMSDVQQDTLNWGFSLLFGSNGALIALGVLGTTALIYTLAAWLLKMDSVYGYYLAIALQGISAFSSLMLNIPTPNIFGVVFLAIDLCLVYYLYQNIPS